MGPIDRLIEILAALRTPETGCAWDLRQTHESLAPYAIEEAYELADAIARGDIPDVRDELGDCLLQVVYHVRLAEEAGCFAFADVVDAICAKMLRRHPHVFPAAPAVGGASEAAGGDAGREGQVGATPARWETIKAEERAGRPRGSSLLADVATALPGLTRAVKLQRRAASVGFDWNEARQVLAKVREEVDEVEAELGGDVAALHDEIGDLLFAVSNLARHAGVDPEAAIRSANAKFERRFAFIEHALAARGASPLDAALAEMEALWNEAKRAERRQADVIERAR